jgi:hypothetical protein
MLNLLLILWRETTAAVKAATQHLWQSARLWWAPPATRRPQLFRVARVEDFPDTLQATILYLAGEGEHLWAAALLCPCGCRETIQLNLLKQSRPCWSVAEHADGAVSLHPSVWRQKGCKSHFILRHGQIHWC